MPYYSRMPTWDEEIARMLREAERSGELQQAKSYGKPLTSPEGWDDTPEDLRMAFKILKEAGAAPPEIALFHERAELRGQLEACTDDEERERLRLRLAQLEQKISLRLESLRGSGRL
ncbi:MAG: DUF1992 domain-containing protein [Bacillota bacterium]